MSGEPNWCALPPFTTRGSTSPATPSGRGFNLNHLPEMRMAPNRLGPFSFLVEAVGIEPTS